jgi:2-amino-4-hydroxy-6-hydroxymethyldihydropteridine diphosphokinase
MSTPVEPRGLLERLQSIERQLDRTGKGQGLPRTIDLDIVLYGQRIVSLPDLVIPHPKMARRPFVLVPMAEVDPGYIHPVMKRTIRELLEHVDDVSSVRFYKKMDHEQMDGRGMSAC